MTSETLYLVLVMFTNPADHSQGGTLTVENEYPSSYLQAEQCLIARGKREEELWLELGNNAFKLRCLTERQFELVGLIDD